MDHKIWYDEEMGVMVIKVVGNYTVDDVKESMNVMDRIMEKRERCPLIVDLREAPPTLDKKVRKMLKESQEGTEPVKTAMLTSNPAVRMMGKVVTSAMGRGKTTGFFKTMEEAKAWLNNGGGK
ncbi:hypothetical protein GF359_00345 [candidate division WOR-3 bacterium]|uniref:DUF7793 domain-containing protein n=1 Tax=candidate division WOR-3 bacterium TaxID=2052148 RepID=A0A9D5QC39_UNCW3|nr:hypothetical protein [candidate division WOR-3 bacterium]MBD3363642.1 hypothetical protein [candidate division WOR-3 bacterium]